MPVQSWLRATRDLVLPRDCAGCGRSGTWWCEDCADALRVAPSCSALDDDTVVLSAASYRGPAGRAVVAAKEQGVAAALGPLSAALARAVAAGLREVAVDEVVLVPVPSRAGAVRERGSDVVAELARGAARDLARHHISVGGGVSVLMALAHRRRVRDQAGLGAEERSANLAGALRVRGLARSELRAGERAFVVVDDVLTTGATLREAVRAVRALTGPAPLFAAVVARTARDR